MLRLESPSGKCAKLNTVTASNNRDHLLRSLLLSLLGSTINCSSTSQALLEVIHQDHSIITCLHHIIWVLFLCTSRSWWIAHSPKRLPSGCNNRPPFPNELHRSQVLFVKVALGTTFTSWSQHHFFAIEKLERQVHKAS